jgi:hypothetical protein
MKAIFRILRQDGKKEKKSLSGFVKLLSLRCSASASAGFHLRPIPNPPFFRKSGAVPLLAKVRFSEAKSYSDHISGRQGIGVRQDIRIEVRLSQNSSVSKSAFVHLFQSSHPYGVGTKCIFV